MSRDAVFLNTSRQAAIKMNDSLSSNRQGQKLLAFYDVLFCSEDSALWHEYSNFFKVHQPALRVGYLPSPDKLQPVLSRLAPEGLLLYDLRNARPELTDEQVKMWGRIKDRAVVIGLHSSEDLPELCENGPWLRLDAVISAGTGALESWSRIQHIRNALKQPLMSLRIEDVEVSSIFQLLTMSERASNVVIHGRVGESFPWVDGRLFLQNGVLQFAMTGEKSGNEAVHELLALKNGTLEVYSCYWLPGRRNIQGTMDRLLLDFAVGYDETSTPSDPPAPAPAPVSECVEEVNDPGFEKEELAVALTAGSWGAPAQRESPDRFQGVSSFQMFKTLWADISPALIDRLERVEQGRLPLDWMTPGELASHLDLHPGQRVVALRGSLDFLICILVSWREHFQMDRLAAGARPVIRLEDEEGGSIWLVGDLDDQPLDVLGDYPCAVWTEPKEADLTLRRTAALGHPSVVLMTSDLKLYNISLNWGFAYEGRVTVPHDGILLTADSWSHVRRGLGRIVQVLKGLAVRCK